jgi:hypothetical protein
MGRSLLVYFSLFQPGSPESAPAPSQQPNGGIVVAANPSAVTHRELIISLPTRRPSRDLSFWHHAKSSLYRWQ